MNANTLDVLFRLPFLLPLLRWWHAFMHAPGSTSQAPAPADFFNAFAFPRAAAAPETPTETTARLEAFLRDDPAFNAAALRGRTTWALPTLSPILFDHARPGYNLHHYARVAPTPQPDRRAFHALTSVPTASQPANSARLRRRTAFNPDLVTECLGVPVDRFSHAQMYLAQLDQSSALHLRRQNARLLAAYALNSAERAFAHAVIAAVRAAKHAYSTRFYAALWTPSAAHTFLSNLRNAARATSTRAFLLSTPFRAGLRTTARSHFKFHLNPFALIRPPPLDLFFPQKNISHGRTAPVRERTRMPSMRAFCVWG